MGTWKPTTLGLILSAPLLVATEGRNQSSVDHRSKTTELGSHLKISPTLKFGDFMKHSRVPYYLKRQVGSQQMKKYSVKVTMKKKNKKHSTY